MATKSRDGTVSELRVIAGLWRGRRIAFPGRPGLRPTPNRVRETLFNWLQPSIAGARCLDLFAGSGALGIEALSRGAAHGYFVEQSASTGRVLRRNLEASGFADRTTVLATGVPQALRRLAADAIVMGTPKVRATHNVEEALEKECAD